MEILNKLQKVTGFDFSKLKKFQGKCSIVFKLFSDNRKIINNGPVVVVNIGALNKDEATQIKEIIKEAVETYRVPILQDDTRKLLEDFTKVDSESESQELIAYFKGKIPASDIEALRQSIYVDKVQKRGGDIQILKADITARYGNRGRNICLLYSAGYFTSQIRPLYEEMISQADFSPDDFDTIYGRIVNESPYAVFINRDMSNEEAEQTVRDRIVIAKKYSITYLNIHGIGKDNVDKIIYILEKLRPELSYPEEMKRQGNVIIVKVQF